MDESHCRLQPIFSFLQQALRFLTPPSTLWFRPAVHHEWEEKAPKTETGGGGAVF